MVPMRKESDETPLVQGLRVIPGLKVRVAEPLARYTSIKVGGPADYFIEVANRPGLAQALECLSRYGVSVYLLGRGSNVLVSDLGVRGAVLRMGEEFSRVEWREEGEKVWASVGAAYPVTQLVRAAARRGYSGLEFAEGIPGTVGGALVMNAGAYGSEIERVVEQVEGLTLRGEPVGLARKDMVFSYRESNLPPGTVVTQVRLRLFKREASAIASTVKELVAKRKKSQPSGYPNSGSMFRNPPGDFAGRLIEAAGLKGKRIGQAEISQRHANFIVNLGGARAQQVRELMELARSEVKKRFAVELEPEVRFVGEWPARSLAS